jgi:hypothetical protein
VLTSARLLDLDPDLGTALDAQRYAAARAALHAQVLSVPSGEWAWAESLPAPERVIALAIGSGVLARRARVHTGTAFDLLGPGDVIRPWSGGRDPYLAIDVQVSWHVLVPAQLAIVDHDLIRRALPWPEIMAAILDRAITHTRELAFRQAASGHARIEDRLWLVLWQIAERFGRRTRDGVVIALPGLTHATLAGLVAATRSSVTKALGDLRARGLVGDGGSGVLLLRGSADEGLTRPSALVG